MGEGAVIGPLEYTADDLKLSLETETNLTKI